MFGWTLTAKQAMVLAGWTLFALHLVKINCGYEKDDIGTIAIAILWVGLLS